MVYKIIKVILFFCLFAIFFGFFYFLRENRIIGRKAVEIQNRISTASVNRTRERRRNVGLEKSQSFLEKLLEKPERQFIYSGIGRKFPGVTIEIWTLMLIFSAAGVYVLSFMITREIVKAICIMMVYIGLVKLLESFLVLRNYKAVDSELLQFLELISNFSPTNGEITAVFMQSAKYLKEPLKTELVECYYDAYTSGDTKSALEALEEQVENPMFKDIINNIVICLNYSANYQEVISSSRKTIREEQRAREERKSLARESVISMLLLSVLLTFALSIADGLLAHKSIWVVLFQTTVGKIALVLIVVCYMIFAWKVWSVDR